MEKEVEKTQLIGEEMNAVLQQDLKSVSLIEVYLELQRIAERRFGENAVVIMEVGSFFEVYGVDNDEMTLGKPKEIAHILNLQLTRKNKSILENSVSNPMLAGFPGASFERYVNRLMQEQKYTVVVVRQRGIPPKVERYVDRVLSPGVNFDYALDQAEPRMTSLVVDSNNGVYSVGLASIDIRTGTTQVHEMHGTSEDPSKALDETFRLIRDNCAELLVTLASEKDEIDMHEVLQYLEIYDTPPVHKNAQRLRIEYQNELFKTVYGVESQLSPVEYLELERQPLASESLALLIEFVMEHDVHVLQQLEKPELSNPEDELYLGNNPLEQLDIISRHKDQPTVLQLVDKTGTSMGRRLLLERLRRPSTNREQIMERYGLVESVRSLEEQLRPIIRSIYDLDRLQRRVAVQRLHPLEVNFLHDSLASIDELLGHLPAQALELLDAQSVQAAAAECREYIHKTYALNETAKVLSVQIQDCFFQRGVDADLDKLVKEATALEEQLASLQQQIAAVLAEETDKEDATEYVSVRQLDKEGHYVHLTKNRYHLIKDQLQQLVLTHADEEIPFTDLAVKVQTSNVKITGGPISELSDQLMTVQTKIARQTRAVYAEQLQRMGRDFGELLKQISMLVARIDVALSTARVAYEHQYVQPEILEYSAETGQQLHLNQVRHPLVEIHEERGIYVPNDVVLEREATRGVLLYGINSSGKSSLMKSIGICVVLAQAGMYVPANSMRFTLFNELFTRVVARDHFEKGLSSFAVEMMEMKNVFNRASERSLVLGDEISHGTETISAISIVSGAVLRLEEMGALFVCTTHLHELDDIEELQNLEHVESMHLAVHYDEEQDLMVFDRKLQEGSGSSIYGLEFARSLHMDPSFIKKAMDIRKRLIDSYDDVERLQQKQTTKYNKDVYLTSCAVCASPVEDVHHIRHQQEADHKGRIDHFDKDHKYNLIPLCKECHMKAHHGTLEIKGFKMTSKGMQLEFEDTQSD